MTNSSKRTDTSKIFVLHITSENILDILNKYPEAKYIIVPEYLSKVANTELKGKYIKWYVINSKNTHNILKFFKQHNKIIWNFIEQNLFMKEILEICDIIILNKEILEKNRKLLDNYKGSIVLL